MRRRRSRAWPVLGLMLIALAGGSVARADVNDPDRLFDEAFMKESGERDLEGAIALYRQTVAHSAANAHLAAKARLRLAQCYERLGNEPAADDLYKQLLAGGPSVPSEIRQAAQTARRRSRSHQPSVQP